MGVIYQFGAISPVLLNTLSQELVLFMPLIKTNEFWRLGTQPPDFSTVVFIKEIYKIKYQTEIIGLILCAILMKYIGRKITLQLFMLVGMISFLIFYFARDVPTLKAAIFLSSLYSGSTIYLGSIIIGEYSNPKYRGIFLLLSTSASIAIRLFTKLVTYIPYSAIIGIGISFLVLAVGLTQIFPESPMWLATRQRYEESEQAFYKLRGKDDESVKEIKKLILTLKAREVKLTLREHIRKFIGKFISPEFLKPCGVMVAAAALVAMSGKQLFNNYVFRGSLTSDVVPDFTYTLLIVAECLAVLVSTVTVYFGRRRTLILTTGWFACFLIFLIVVFCAIMNRRAGIIVSFLAIYKFLIDLFCTPLPLILMGEVFPLEHKGKGMVVTGLFSNLLKFATGESLEVLLAHPFWMLLLYTMLMAMSLAVLYFVLPDTKDLTLQSIEKYFLSKSKNERNRTADI